jgi:hypothetical protein
VRFELWRRVCTSYTLLCKNCVSGILRTLTEKNATCFAVRIQMQTTKKAVKLTLSTGDSKRRRTRVIEATQYESDTESDAGILIQPEEAYCDVCGEERSHPDCRKPGQSLESVLAPCHSCWTCRTCHLVMVRKRVQQICTIDSLGRPLCPRCSDTSTSIRTPSMQTFRPTGGPAFQIGREDGNVVIKFLMEKK